MFRCGIRCCRAKTARGQVSERVCANGAGRHLLPRCTMAYPAEMSTDPKPFGGRLALVTGASRGLGRAVARHLGNAGAHVVALARTVGGLEELDEEIKAAGGSATLVPLDICDDGGLERMGAALHDRWGHLDLWIHTAIHAAPRAPAEHIDAKDLDKSLATNVRAFQRLIRVVDPLLRKSSHGRAFAFEDAGTECQNFYGAYHMTKTAQIALAEMWGRELAGATDARVAIVRAPPLPTAVRARFYPGEDQRNLTRLDPLAKRVAQAAIECAQGHVDLTTE